MAASGMPTVRALCSLPMDSGLPEDAVTNTWHFSATLTDVTSQLAGITTALTNFYQAVDVYLSTRITNTLNITYYRLDDPSPRTPIGTGTATLTPGTTGILPQELALCVSFEGAKSSGVEQAHRRGRIYLGPLDAGVATSDRPASAARTAIAAAGSALETAAFAAGTPWVVYSPTLGSSTNVTNGWVDDAFDVQRRRGLRPTTRTTWS